MGVASGSPVSASNSNQAWLDANADDSALGKIDFANTDPASGVTVTNIQKNVNSLNHYSGRPSNDALLSLPSWINNDVGSNTNNLKERADALTEKFNASSGHKHTGAAGDAPPVDAFDLANVVLKGTFVRGTNFTTSAASSDDVSSLLPGAVPSTAQTIKGVVVNAPFNRIILRDTNNDKIANGSGDEVYGRLTESSGVWTLSYYVDIAGTETAYTFSFATPIYWYYQQLFNPIVDAPVYSELAVTPSENSTADVVDATETQAGKVLLANAAPAAIAATGAKGSGTRVAKIDHTHEGVHSLFKTGDSSVLGDIELEPGTGITITRSGNKFTFAGSTSTVGYQEVPAGPVNGVNATFGPLSQTPASAESCLVMIDSLVIDKANWTLSGSSIIFNTGYEPQLGQSVYVYYLGSGVPTPPPTPTGTLNTEFRTVSALEAANKIVILAGTPAVPGQVLVDIIAGGGAQEFNVDYTVVTNEFRWNGYALDGVLSQGDKIRFHYIT